MKTPGTPIRERFDEIVPEDAFVTFVERLEDGSLSLAWSFEQPADFEHWVIIVKTWVTLKLDGEYSEWLSYPHPDTH